MLFIILSSNYCITYFFKDATLYQHSFKDASRPASKANPQGMSLNTKGGVLYASRVPVNNNSFLRNNFGRKTSPSNNGTEHFHLASSVLQQFDKISCLQTEEINSFCSLAANYVLSGHSLSEICEHNAAIARKYGKFHVKQTLLCKVFFFIARNCFRFQ